MIQFQWGPDPGLSKMVGKVRVTDSRVWDLVRSQGAPNLASY